MSDINIDLLKKLCSIFGPTGRERGVGEFIRNEIKNYADEISYDSLGNLIAHKKGPGRKLMLAGHMDQIGLIVTYIEDDGFLRFTNVGGVSPGSTLHRRVVFKDGLTGVVGCERLDDGTNMTLERMYIDIGAADRAEAEALVRFGDACVYAPEPVSDGKKIISPALDDRVGCFVMIEVLKRLKNPASDLYFVFTTQEEIGLKGARTSAFSVDPEYAIAFDVTLAFDYPKARKLPMKLGAGAAIKLKDASLICHPLIVKHLTDCAVENGIKHQFEILESGGTDSGAIQISRAGVPAGVLSVPTRYVHSAAEMCLISDVSDAISLTVRALEKEIKE